MRAPARIEIVVDELVVRGLPPEQARAAAAALEARLTELADGATRILARAEAVRRLPPVEAPAGSPAALGGSVAAAVWSAIAPGGGR